jgi:hypothetical protein
MLKQYVEPIPLEWAPYQRGSTFLVQIVGLVTGQPGLLNVNAAWSLAGAMLTGAEDRYPRFRAYGLGDNQIAQIERLIVAQQSADAAGNPAGGPLYDTNAIPALAQNIAAMPPVVYGPTAEEIAAPPELTAAEKLIAGTVEITEKVATGAATIAPSVVSTVAGITGLTIERVATSVDRINRDRASKGLPPLPAETIAREVAATQVKMVGATDEAIDAAVAATLEKLYDAANPETAEQAAVADTQYVAPEVARQQNVELIAAGLPGIPVITGLFTTRNLLIGAGVLTGIMLLKGRK